MIINTIAAGGAGGAMPDYIWVEYEITKVAGLPWRRISNPIIQDRAYPVHKDDCLHDTYDGINFDSATGKITGSSEHWIRRYEVLNPTDVNLWIYDRGVWLNIRRVRSAQIDENHRGVMCTCYASVHSEPTYTITYGAIKTIHLNEQTGDQFRKIPIIK